MDLAATEGADPVILKNLGEADGDYLQAIIDALKGNFNGVIVLSGCTNDLWLLQPAFRRN